MNSGNSTLRFIYSLVLAALVFFVVTFVARNIFDSKNGAAVPGMGQTGETPEDLLAYERNTIAVFQEASPAVVFVHNLQQYRSFFSYSATEVQKGTGSGFLWDDRGHIVTNYHVVYGADRVAVTLIDGKTYKATIVGVEPPKDIAVLKIDLRETNVTPFSKKIADSGSLIVGQKAVAIGNPYGLDHTLTVGNVSALARSMSSVVEGITIRDMVQTDAPINPGNSGGPLLNSRGELIGINTLILRNSTGIGFAVPSNTVSRIVSQIIRYGQAIRTGIGVSIFEDRVSARAAGSFGVEGILINEVFEGRPAETAGLRGTSRDRFGNIILGDIIISIDSEPIRGKDDLYHAFDNKKSGEEISMVYLRNGKQETLSIPLVNVSN